MFLEENYIANITYYHLLVSRASTFLCGLTILITIIPEVPVFYYASSILSYLGESGSLIVAYLCYIFRVYGYTLLTPESVWWILGLVSVFQITDLMTSLSLRLVNHTSS